MRRKTIKGRKKDKMREALTTRENDDPKWNESGKGESDAESVKVVAVCRGDRLSF